MSSSFHVLNVGASRSAEEGWGQPSSSSTTSTSAAPKPASSSPRLRRLLLITLFGSLAFAAVFAGGLAVLRSSERERGGPYPTRPLSEASPLGAAGGGGGDGDGGSGSGSGSGSSLSSSPPLRFLVIGDWGRRGNRAQREVAAAMTRRVREVRAAAAAAAAAGSSPSLEGRAGAPFHESFVSAGRSGPEFVLTVGDNFYQSGLLSAEDPAFDESFVDVYSSPELAIPWLGVLGNHDFGEQSSKAEKKRMKKEKKKKKKEAEERGDDEGVASAAAADGDDDGDEDEDEEELPAPPRPSREQCAAALGASSSASSSSSSSSSSQSQCSFGPLSQLGARLPQRDPRWRVSRAFSLRLRGPRDAATGGVSLAGFDTTPLVDKYQREAWARVPGGVADQRGTARAGLLELGAALERERAAGTRWRLAVGHHPFASLAAPLRTPELDPLLAGPLRHSSAVFAGHDHTLQFLRWPSAPGGGGARRPPVVISGGGSDVGGSDAVNASAVAPGSAFADAGGADAFFARRRGFADCVVTAAELRCDLVSGADGSVLFTAVVPAEEQRGAKKQKEEGPLPPASPAGAGADAKEETAAAAAAAAAAATPPPHSPPAPVAAAEPEKSATTRPRRAAEAGAEERQQFVDAAPRPPPVPHLSRR